MLGVMKKSDFFSVKKFCLLSILIFSLLGCICKEYLRERPDFPEKVAVLAMTNYTNDLEGPDIIRALFYHRVSEMGYSPIPIEEVDELLNKEGISEGGQLSALSPRELGKILGVKGLFYGDLIEFNYINIGFVTSRIVRVRFKLVEAETEEILWEKEARSSKSNVTFLGEEAKEAFVEGIAEQVVEMILRSPLKEEAEGCVEKIMRTLPRRG